MGCANSKNENLPAVILCRHRCNFLDEALHRSYDFANAHRVYLQSLKAIGPALQSFADRIISDPDSSAGRVSSVDFNGAAFDSELRNHETLTDSDHGRNESLGLISNRDFRFEAPPPPPPPPPSSDWDYFNIFEILEPSYTITTKEITESEYDRNVNQRSENSEPVEPMNKEIQSKINMMKSIISTKLLQVFENATDLGKEVLNMFDSGEVSSSVNQLSDEVSTNLCSTLNKLHTWEQKIYNEVKAEEKLRKTLAKKADQLNLMMKKGADAHKIESSEDMIRTLNTKMEITIHMIDNMSISIDKLRDEELWPQICDLVFRLSEMWEAMMVSYRREADTIAGIKNLDSTALSYDKLESAHLEVAVTLKTQLLKWVLSFSIWLEVQRNYVKALNGWLKKCFLQESNVGAPPVFVIINRWSQLVDRVSDKEVIESVHAFMANINHALHKYSDDLESKSVLDKDFERKILLARDLERKLQTVMQSRERNTIRKENESGLLQETSKAELDLQHIFMAVVKFASDSKHEYEELQLCIEQIKLSAK